MPVVGVHKYQYIHEYEMHIPHLKDDTPHEIDVYDEDNPQL